MYQKIKAQINREDVPLWQRRLIVGVFVWVAFMAFCVFAGSGIEWLIANVDKVVWDWISVVLISLLPTAMITCWIVKNPKSGW